MDVSVTDAVIISEVFAIVIFSKLYQAMIKGDLPATSARITCHFNDSDYYRNQP